MMRKVAYMVFDTQDEELIGSVASPCTMNDAECSAYDLNMSVCPLVETEDGIEYADPMPERYKPVKVIIEDLE